MAFELTKRLIASLATTDSQAIIEQVEIELIDQFISTHADKYEFAKRAEGDLQQAYMTLAQTIL